MEARIVGFVKNMPSSDKKDEEGITQKDLNTLENELDKLFQPLEIDISPFGKHFRERINDERNKKEGGMISIEELKLAFEKLFQQRKNDLKNLRIDDQKVLVDAFSKLNIPLMIKFDDKEKEISLVPKTIMRKKNFQTPNPKIIVK